MTTYTVSVVRHDVYKSVKLHVRELLNMKISNSANQNDMESSWYLFKHTNF